MYIKILVYLFVFVVISEEMTMKQMHNSGSMMRKSCKPKNNVEDEEIDKLSIGVFTDETNIKCYIACVMKMANTVQNGKVNLELAFKQADLLLPEKIKEGTKSAILECKNSADGYKDICDAAFHATKCIYTANPSVFYFP